jgi:hypothetical protein
MWRSTRDARVTSTLPGVLVGFLHPDLSLGVHLQLAVLAKFSLTL